MTKALNSLKGVKKMSNDFMEKYGMSRSEMIRNCFRKHGTTDISSRQVLSELACAGITDSHVNVIRGKMKQELMDIPVKVVKVSKKEDSKITDSERIRAYFKTHGFRTASKKVVEDLGDVTLSNVNRVKYDIRQKVKERKKMREQQEAVVTKQKVVAKQEAVVPTAVPESMISLDTIFKVKNFIREVGGVENLNKVLKIFGDNK